MIPWWWALAAFIGGEIAGIIIIAICSANERDSNSRSKYIR